MTSVAAPSVTSSAAEGALLPPTLTGIDRLVQCVGNPCEFGSIQSPEGRIRGVVTEVELTPLKLSVTFVERSRQRADGSPSGEHDGEEHLFVFYRSALELVDIGPGAATWPKGEKSRMLFVAYDSVEKPVTPRLSRSPAR